MKRIINTAVIPVLVFFIFMSIPVFKGCSLNQDQKEDTAERPKQQDLLEPTRTSDLTEELKLIIEGRWPTIRKYYDKGFLEEVVLDEDNGIVVLRSGPIKSYGHFKDIEELYFAWNRRAKLLKAEMFYDNNWYVYSSAGSTGKHNLEILDGKDITIPREGIVLIPGPEQSPVIRSVSLATPEPLIIKSEGDLWMNTWADDGNIYSGWGDGCGFGETSTDLGFALIKGSPPHFAGENIFTDPLPLDKEELVIWNDKPSSLISIDGVLYSHLHRPLGDAQVGYLACSSDHGRSWERYIDTSPWTKDAFSDFRCMFFINMGKDYSLNLDGYVYAFGIGREWGWRGDVYLARVPTDRILDYGMYEYFSGILSDGPSWSGDQSDAKPLEGLFAHEQFSSIYHQGTDRYLILTSTYLYDSPRPWGPWTIAGRWKRQGWQGYQPGIMTKGAGDDSFWFTESGQPHLGDDLPYQLCLGNISLETY